MQKPFRRIVTGHNAAGKAIMQEDGPPARFQQIGGEAGPVFYEVWNTRATPAPIDRASGEPPESGIVLAPPGNGTRIRLLDFPPDDPNLAQTTPQQARAHFAAIGAADASSHTGEGSRHAHMHRTQTIDYGIVIEGELVLIVDEGETVVRAGDYRGPARDQPRLGEPLGQELPDRVRADRRGVHRWAAARSTGHPRYGAINALR